MASKIKVDNIENQCGGAVVTKCGATTTISGSVVKANDIQAADGGNIINQCGTTITLGASGDTINLASGASQTGFGRTGTVDWDTTAKTASFTAVSGNGYFVNTTSGAVTMTLPASPSAGDIVAVADYANTFATNNLTIARNGSLINGAALDYENSTNGISLTFVYVDGTRGWKNVNDATTNATGQSDYIIATGGTIVTCGSFKTHVFTGPGTFTVSCGGTPAGSNTVEYFVAAGGGGGGPNGGGGGGGGFRLYTTAPGSNSPLNHPSNALPVSIQGYSIAVGGGGAVSTNGSVSTFSTITSAGGGFGGQTTAPKVGGPGGSGGGAGRDGAGTVGGSGNTPPVSPPQGTNGGSSPAPTYGGGGGGGGASTVGSNSGGGSPGSEFGGNGGPGSYVADSLIGPTAPSYGTPGPVGSTRWFSGGGGGGSSNTGTGPSGAGDAGVGGAGRGGGGGPAAQTVTAGVTNTGGGGGGGSDSPGCAAAGGSGIVMIRYRFQA
jgi:hypothetical protein